MESAIFSDCDEEIQILRKRRRENWVNPVEMEAFLDLWEENCQQLSLLKRNLTLYYKMSRKMASLGFHREPLELRKKVSNVITKYKTEREHGHSSWPYLERVHRIYSKMKEYKKMTQGKQNKNEESRFEKPRNEMKKIFLISQDSNVCFDETDMETILKAMNGEDIVTENNDGSTNVQSNKTTNKTEDEDDDSRSSDRMSEASNQSTENITSARNILENMQANKFTSPTSSIKRKNDVQELDTKREKTFPGVIVKTKDSKTCYTEKDEIDLYAELIATKLRSMDDKSRHIAMNKIDNILFELKMEQLEGQPTSQNRSIPQKSPIPKE